jgi:hypothetical protein
MASILTPARTCNGTGTCQTVTSTVCDPYACNTTGACRTTCTTNADCVAPNTCISGSCGKKPNGTACAAATECNSAFCAQGVCCNSACTGTCQSCALTGTVGTCSSVPAGGQDPLARCAVTAATTCGTDGTCNGSGACRVYASGTQCAPATCTGSTLTAARTCNGSGACQAATTSQCTPYACGTTGACRTTCTGNADCAAPNVCTGTTCGVPSNLKVQYLAADLGASSQMPKPHLTIVNSGSTPVPLSELTVRYWYTIDGVQSQTGACDYAFIGCSNITQTFQAVAPARTNADHFMQVSFSATAGNIPANANSGVMQLRFHKNDYAFYTQGNDYSFDVTKTASADWNRITLYRNNVLVWGTEP